MGIIRLPVYIEWSAHFYKLFTHLPAPFFTQLCPSWSVRKERQKWVMELAGDLDASHSNGRNKRQARKASSKHLVVKLEMVVFSTQEETMVICSSGAAVLSPLQQAQRELTSSCLSIFSYGDVSAHFCPSREVLLTHCLARHATCEGELPAASPQQRCASIPPQASHP